MKSTGEWSCVALESICAEWGRLMVVLNDDVSVLNYEEDVFSDNE